MQGLTKSMARTEIKDFSLTPEISDTKNKHTYKTFLFLQNNENIDVKQNEVVSILLNFVESGGFLFNQKKKKFLGNITNHIQSNRKNDKIVNLSIQI